MGKLRYIPWHFEHARMFNSDRTELYYEYLRQCSRYCTKDAEGYFTRSGAQIEKYTGLKRSVQDKSRKLLTSLKLIECRLASQQSPTVSFKVPGESDENRGYDPRRMVSNRR